MGSMMAKSCRGHRPLNLEIGFEAGRGSRDVLGRAYERLLPLLARSPSPSAQATLAEGARYDNPAFESGFSSSRSAGCGPSPGLGFIARPAPHHQPPESRA